MVPVRVLGVDRPGLAARLHARGLAVAAEGVVTLAADGLETAGSTVVEAADPAAAARALDRGAADAVCLSDPDELVAARLAALARRSSPIRVGDLAIDTADRRASRAGRPLPLLPREYALLLCLARAGGTVVARDRLLQTVWGLAFDPGTNVVAVHVSRLRSKLGGATQAGAPVLETVRGVGYRLAPAAGAG